MRYFVIWRLGVHLPLIPTSSSVAIAPGSGNDPLPRSISLRGLGLAEQAVSIDTGTATSSRPRSV